jgi:type VI secretion system protein ImpE
MQRTHAIEDSQCRQLLRDGELDHATRKVSEWVRQDPTDSGNRVGLFQLLAASGQWTRASEQLRVAGELDAEWLPVVGAYRHAIGAEQEREQVMAGNVTPLMASPVPRWQQDLLAALREDHDGQAAQAASRRRHALSQAEGVGGHVDGRRFEWLGDADPRFGPCLEVVFDQGYSWVTFSSLRSIEFSAPQDVRDLLWRQAALVLRNGQRLNGLVPARYPNTEASAVQRLRLAQMTDWVGEQESAKGLGQRVLITESDEYPMLGVRRIDFDPSPSDGDWSWPN